MISGLFFSMKIIMKIIINSREIKVAMNKIRKDKRKAVDEEQVWAVLSDPPEARCFLDIRCLCVG